MVADGREWSSVSGAIALAAKVAAQPGTRSPENAARAVGRSAIETIPALRAWFRGGAQILLKRSGLEQRERFLTRATAAALLRLGVTIVNENDTSPPRIRSGKRNLAPPW